MAFPSARLIFLALFLVCSGMMGFGYYLEYVLELEPCPLCITQRAFIVACGLTGLVAAIHKPGPVGVRVYGAVAALFCVTGGSFSGRQIWLQSLPADQAPACGPSLQYMLETFPLTEALSLLIRGDGNCAEVLWTFLGLSIPAWTLVAFAGLCTMALFAAIFRADHRAH